MDKIKDLANLAALIETQGPTTIHPSLLDGNFDWQFNMNHPGFTEPQTDELRAAHQAALRFCSDLIGANEDRTSRSWRWRWLSLVGKQGRGKTHLARRIAAWRATKGPGRTFYRWIDILDDCRGNHDNIALFRERCEMDRLMIVDDLAAGNETEFSGALMYQLFERRLGKPTVLTTNLTVEQIAKMDTRLASRMHQGRSEIFRFTTAPDYRMMNEIEHNT